MSIFPVTFWNLIHGMTFARNIDIRASYPSKKESKLAGKSWILQSNFSARTRRKHREDTKPCKTPCRSRGLSVEEIAQVHRKCTTQGTTQKPLERAIRRSTQFLLNVFVSHIRVRVVCAAFESCTFELCIYY